ncbi:MAG TPA: tryptophan 7-halogenase [Planctomycetaceae bacterium]|nr:tryptophan 7-halogenase [Planctomycetaceae bacterium]
MLTPQIQRVVIVGRDVQLWISALAVERALGADAVQVTALELPTTLVDTDVVAAVPALSELHRQLGLDDHKLLRECDGLPMVAQRFANWARSKETFLHGYDVSSPGERDLGILQYWLKARDRGMLVAFEEFSVAAAAAKQGRVPRAGTTFEPDMAVPSHGFQLDAVRYAEALKQTAMRRAIDCRTGRATGVNLNEGRIASVDWDSGDSFEADLFIDASGSEAALIRSMPESEFESWRKWFASDRVLSASAPTLRPAPAFANIVAFRGGWLGIHPLRNRTAVVGAFASDVANDEMLRNLPVLAGVAVTGDVTLTPFEAGIRRRPWIGNCVAVGAAAADLEPLDAALMHFLHLGIAHLLGSLTGGFDPFADSERYNRTITRQAEAIRDFQLAHYRLNGRFDESFWDRARDASDPPSLDGKLAAFKSHGSIPVADDEPFQQANWAAVLIGHGLIPESYAPWVDELSEADHIQTMQQRLRSVAQAVSVMPTVDEFVADLEPVARA